MQTCFPIAGPIHAIVVGAGVTELRTAALLTGLGCTVECIDQDPLRIEPLAAGSFPTFDSMKQASAIDAFRSGLLTFGSNLSESLKGADCVFLSPPVHSSARNCNLQAAFAAARQVGESFRINNVGLPVVVQSPVPSGFTSAIGQVITSHFGFGDCLAFSPPPYTLPDGEEVALVASDCEGARTLLAGIYSPHYGPGRVIVTGLAAGESVFDSTRGSGTYRIRRDSARPARVA